jgi:Domain of unknown function (DUF4350)
MMQLSSRFHIKKIHLLIVGLALVVLALLYWFYTKLEWEEHEIDLGYSSEARQNPFLAAELFLRNQGVTVTRVNNVSLLEKQSWRELHLEPNDTILLINSYKTLTNESYKNISSWIENGGTFIMSARNPFMGSHTSDEDFLFEEFGVEPTTIEKTDEDTNFFKKIAEDLKKQQEEQKQEKQKEKKQNEEKKKKEDTCVEEEKTITIPFASDEKPLVFDFSTASPLQRLSYSDDEDNQQELSSDKKHLFYFNWGEGSVTFVSDETIWSNRRIHCHDHAYGLWRLINPYNRIWILVNQDAPSLAAILWRYIPFAVISCSLALFFWLWSSSQTFGPVQTVTQTQRRSLTEHLHASAMLLWRRQQQVQLLKQLRQSILSRLHSVSAIAFQSDQEKIEYLFELSKIPKKQIEKALFSEQLEHPQEFINAVVCLQSLVKIVTNTL